MKKKKQQQVFGSQVYIYFRFSLIQIGLKVYMQAQIYR